VTFTDPQTRTGLRALVQALVVIGMLALAYWLTGLMTEDRDGLRELARMALGILAIATLFNGLENVTRTFKMKVGAGGIDLEQSADASVAAQTVADSAQTTADDIKEAVTTEGKS
jgi:ABC-type transport system involved in cytochrome c biogenesis permease component